jgi:GLPGLI family protein
LYENNTRGIKNYEQEIALILSESENTCYTDLITKINYFQITENEIFRDAEFILIDTLNYNWQLSNEIKLIDNYKCYKATLKIDKNVSGTKNDLNITAWYSPEIPIAFGPNGFSGLPGLILELDYKNVKFSARSITLNSNTNFEIKKPSKGIEINRDKYIKLLKERTPDFKEFE